MIRVIFGVHLPAHHLAAVQVHDQVQVEPSPRHGGWQVGHVPAPHLARGCGDVGGWRPLRPGRSRSAVAGILPSLAQHPAQSSIHWPGNCLRRPAWARCAQQASPQSAARWPRAAIRRVPPHSKCVRGLGVGHGDVDHHTTLHPLPGFASAAGCVRSDTQLAGPRQSSPGTAGLGDEFRHLLTIFKRGHSSSSLSLLEDRLQLF